MKAVDEGKDEDILTERSDMKRNRDSEVAEG